jgi:hypothetical protein
MKSKTARAKKKSYRRPRLVMYGDLRRLTMAKGGTKADTAKPASRSTGSPG